MADRPKSLPARAYGLFTQVACSQTHPLAKLVPFALLLLDAVFCAAIIWKIPYTEIDWKAYMEQVSQFVNGERDYTVIKGGTGPLVYPGFHVYIYTGLYWLTDQGRNILLAQQLFALLYMATLALVMSCYWKAKVPPYVFPLLILSKRLHSIFMLRCFNDCFAAFFLWLTIYLFQRKWWTAGALSYSLGLGVKMTLLLDLPAVGIILFLAKGLSGSLKLAALMAQIQYIMAQTFLRKNAKGYLSRAFELSRQFLFKWTVNWRFLGEEVFLSRRFALTLLAGHVSFLIRFILNKWLKPTGKPAYAVIIPLLQFKSPFTAQEEYQIASRLTPAYVATTILSANLIGLLFARTLHYQFYAYIAWATPFLLWRAGAHPVLQYALWALQEWAWNVYPSTPVSSGVVVAVLATTVGLVYLHNEVAEAAVQPPQSVGVPPAQRK
ncbi:glycosyltransferase [Microdochium trichocladiopsis]|uniref:Dol-P-Man:Man(5)GlcNAc(2)-PP-Dol alpha-1,3-mannosyltransferase n=1 Tax=Microdochium trichocladiopsis TaxID=1682393 RepID=A0A9P9BQT5_9PEZI|nr:glycosyltransferase [Microdochium trichocladiopsis]KAH7031247.1 glycosyltransferase [Microdochium trichocladiopsis]